jgi:2-polyprenyl-6-methoxyphenol hydroxylase-like FAD-dependent oxidoreductase
MNDGGLDCDVIICGAGPVGLSAALKLASHGISCHILEKRECLNLASRASTFHPPTLEILDEFSLLDIMLQLGCKAERIAYSHAGGDTFAEFNQPVSLGEDTHIPFRVHLEQSAITPHLLRKAIETGIAQISYQADVHIVGQDQKSAWAKFRSGGMLRAKYLLGADGAQSSVRRSMGIQQEGSKYPGQVLRLMVDKNLKTLMPELAPVSYIYSKTLRSISLLEMPDCWRIIIRVPEGIDDDEAKNPKWYMPILEEFLPKAANHVTVKGTDVYGASKMLASSNCSGRIGLIGDAVHLTNTKGGMNMNCGIHDAYAVASSIIRELQSSFQGTEMFEAVLSERLRFARDVLLPRTDKNVTGMEDWLEFISNAAADPAKARAYLLTSAMIDMAPERETANP